MHRPWAGRFGFSYHNCRSDPTEPRGRRRPYRRSGDAPAEWVFSPSPCGAQAPEHAFVHGTCSARAGRSVRVIWNQLLRNQPCRAQRLERSRVTARPHAPRNSSQHLVITEDTSAVGRTREVIVAHERRKPVLTHNSSTVTLSGRTFEVNVYYTRGRGFDSHRAPHVAQFGRALGASHPRTPLVRKLLLRGPYDAVIWSNR
jgi:hypothetical protein